MELDQLLQWIFFSCDLKIKNGFLQVASETLKSKMRKTAWQEKLSAQQLLEHDAIIRLRK